MQLVSQPKYPWSFPDFHVQTVHTQAAKVLIKPLHQLPNMQETMHSMTSSACGHLQKLLHMLVSPEKSHMLDRQNVCTCTLMLSFHWCKRKMHIVD